MVKFFSIALFLISAVSVQACIYCQCLFDNGEHCCVYQNSVVGNLDCNAVCKDAVRKDNTMYTVDPVTHEKTYGTPCKGNGKYKCASIFESGRRTKCGADGTADATTIIQDESLVGKLTDKVIVLSGSKSDIGLGTAKALSVTGATLCFTAPHINKAEISLAKVLEPGRITLVEMGNASFSSMRTSAAVVLERLKDQVNILINNASPNYVM
ncbi:hypothetical protein NHQ30_006619 [Ciborinia camelliae]|nr:hypothetical protein NHQ30_006619 [Ciborinia camelliae]